MPTDPEDKGARAEYTQIVLQVEHDKEEQAGFVQIFRKPTLRRGAILVIFLLFASPSTGIVGISNYLPVIFPGLCLTGVMPLVMYGVWCTIGTLVTLLTIFIVDRVGRRTLLLTAYPLLALVHLAESLLQNAYIDTENRGGLGARLLFLLIYIITFQFIYSPALFGLLRFGQKRTAKGISPDFYSFFIGSLTYTTPSGVAFKGSNMSWTGISIMDLPDALPSAPTLRGEGTQPPPFLDIGVNRGTCGPSIHHRSEGNSPQAALGIFVPLEFGTSYALPTVRFTP
ncbi:uncharacterized protein Z519_12791 [Cladophialophora bantiana CBS 173.52]|uniref:Major facilitator superfamily (MFS) profile domain-containing protein n=1 Tax=Cladophialophora bantiana (strain ATCC 10958 / CBS 173.52 / CDC B-1940 / NIH 8579) TaxID=1442370 RepID=A0A0D2FIT0_CLAB1|nr:uncharacterized protein Z519_12791 [Cladophialophora bantiana CBS 173.52]KIW86607.1 hypothetical protein Z519_12791 [Cladophialophora bantiana CBS 173.52]